MPMEQVADSTGAIPREGLTFGSERVLGTCLDARMGGCVHHESVQTPCMSFHTHPLCLCGVYLCAPWRVSGIYMSL